VPTVLPTEITDPTNARILAVSEDRIAGFLADPFAEIARLAELPAETVHERIRAMLEAHTIRRVRQTLMATNLAPGALIAWKVPPAKLDAAFEYLSKDDPFSGHVVIRSTDGETRGSVYRLWTTLKVPVGFSMRKHCEFLARTIGAEAYRIMPAKRLFALGVGHVRRKGMEPGAKTEEPGRVLDTNIVELSPLDWRVLTALKRELAPEEIGPEPWRARAVEAGVSYDRALLDVPRAREAEQRGNAGDALQCALPLARAAGAGDRGGAGGRSSPHPHPRILARGG
jgi:DNA-binding Lrp family transcriptional regulator